MDFKVFILFLIIQCGLVAKSAAECYMDLAENPSLRPMLSKHIGSRMRVITNDRKFVTLQEDETITAVCPTKFIKPDFLRNQGIQDLTCRRNEINNQYNRMYFECDSLQWSLYESGPFRWCPPPTVSYILARHTPGGGYKFLAGLCYNFHEMTIVSLHYAVAPKSSNYLYPQRLGNYVPTIEVKDIPTSFVDQNYNSSKYDNPQFQEWIKYANYQNHSIIQNPDLYQSSYDKFGGLLDFAWWPGLRLGNWRRYEEALSQHIEVEAAEYDILAGTSGTVAAPIYRKSCQENLTLVELADRTNRKIPLYVWHYLKSTKNDNDDLVVIGVNTPFYEFYSETDLIFCTDICPQIGWLQKVHSTFHYQTMGIMFCCSVQDVRTSKRLTGFPVPPKPVTPLPPPPLPMLRSKPSYDALGEPYPIEDESEQTEIELPNDYEI